MLELGSGIGNHTEALLKIGSKVIASDISKFAKYTFKTFGNKYKNLNILEADMEIIPYEDSSFDVVVSAEALAMDLKKLLEKKYIDFETGGYLIIVTL